MYARVCTRSDITTAVNKLSSFLENPNIAHWKAAKRVLRYLKGTISWGLTYAGEQSQICCYADADWAGDLDTRHSTCGIVILLNGTAIQWSSKHQTTIALSTMEAECVAIAHTIKEYLWL